MTAFTEHHIEIHLVSNAPGISPVLKEADLEHTGTLDEYQEFKMNLFAVLDEQEFEVLDEGTGYQSEGCYCIAAVKEPGSTAEAPPCIISVRISGTYSPEAFEAAKARGSLHKKQTLRLEKITVNGKSFTGYYEALEGIRILLSNREHPDK